MYSTSRKFHFLFLFIFIYCFVAGMGWMMGLSFLFFLMGGGGGGGGFLGVEGGGTYMAFLNTEDLGF